MRAWIVVGAAALVAGGVYAYYNPGTVPWLDERLAETGMTPPGSALYRWRDADGQWHVTDTRPPAGIEYERVEYPPDANVVPAPPDDRDER